MKTSEKIFRLALMTLVLSGLGCDDTNTLESNVSSGLNPEHLQQTWFWSYEEDDQTADNPSVYRPASYNFPPSRGRTGFTIFENKISGFKFIVNHNIAPADGLQYSVGQWQLINENEIRFYYDNNCNPNSTQSTIMISEIIELSNEILRLKLKSREVY